MEVVLPLCGFPRMAYKVQSGGGQTKKIQGKTLPQKASHSLASRPGYFAAL